MIITKFDNLHLKIDANENELESISDYFTLYVQNHYHMPLYKSGVWDGKARLFNVSNQILPYGLLSDLIKFYKKTFPNETIKITDDVKQIYRGKEITPVYNLSKVPFYYQKDCIEIALKYSKGIIRSATSSGKSLIITYIIKTLIENNITKHSIIIVPTINLVEQFYSDMVEYGMDKEIIGRVYEKYKEFDKTITISTWQSLMNNSRFLPNYDWDICDDTHQVKATEITKIAKKCIHATWRLGFTGTLPNDRLDMFNLKSYIGPVLKEYSAGQLSEEGYISKCNINVINLSYSDEYNGDYNIIKQNVFQHKQRMKLITKIANKADSNILILVGQVKKEGNVLLNYIKNKTEKEVIFLHGKNRIEEREFWRKECENRKDIILIATYGIFSQGLNIPSLKYVLLGSPFKSEIRVLQSIGRALRKHIDKIDGAVIYDIIDDCKYLIAHGKKRIKYYKNENFNIKEMDISINDLLFENDGLL